ncbi:MAG: excalibur calcium-binding domain-containing protein [Buchananella hordeovulneris]|nr:excalibur calcium-binding domain-containing protein [Buchananella hordeovulneris]
MPAPVPAPEEPAAQSEGDGAAPAGQDGNVDWGSHEQPAEPEPVYEEPAPEPEPVQENVFYQNCSEAKAAGAAPLYEGEPGYRRKLDRDGDGVACER